MLTVLLCNPSNHAYSAADKDTLLRDFLSDAEATAIDGRSDKHGEALARLRYGLLIRHTLYSFSNIRYKHTVCQLFNLLINHSHLHLCLLCVCLTLLFSFKFVFAFQFVFALCLRCWFAG